MKAIKIQKPFSIEEWENGAKVETRDGRPVRILCTDRKGKLNPILGLYTNSKGDEMTASWRADGIAQSSEGYISNPLSLVIVEEVAAPWADDEEAKGEGWKISEFATIDKFESVWLNRRGNYFLFATERQAKSALAMARISQLMAHDERYGGVVTEEEWKEANMVFVITRVDNKIDGNTAFNEYYFLAFHTLEQRELFLSENEQLVKDYLMID